MAGIAQLVRAPDCGSGGRGFKSRYSPQVFYGTKAPYRKARVDFYASLSDTALMYS